MSRQLTCILCPRGCALTVQEADGAWQVTGNACPRGARYGIEECTNPTRTVTSIVRVKNRDTMLSVKTAHPVAKKDTFEVIRFLRGQQVSAPIKVGQELFPDVCGSPIVATKDVE
ncbi:MAG: DUF1667 domain-containing protein [Ruminococcaceae bacterium]|nr:DUF1667 domain-containing protein [Oscillospiraceae bacterium]